MLKFKEKLVRDESMFLSEKDVYAIKWMDNTSVTLLTIMHNPLIMISVNQTKKIVLN